MVVRRRKQREVGIDSAWAMRVALEPHGISGRLAHIGARGARSAGV